jgi:hypothetical protein
MIGQHLRFHCNELKPVLDKKENVHGEGGFKIGERNRVAKK